MRVPRESKPRPLSVSLARFSSAIAVCATMLAAARGATLYWDGDTLAANNAASGAGLGGSGVWDTLAPAKWWSGGNTDNLWSAGTDTAVFSGAAGTVTLGESITAQNLVFNTSDYVLTSATNTLTLGSSPTASAIVNLQDRSGGVVNATIGARLAGNSTSGITLNGNGGTLTLNFAGTHGVTGPLIIRSGTLQVNGLTSKLNTGTDVTFAGSGAFRLDNVGLVVPDPDLPPLPPPSPLVYTLGKLTTGGGDGVVHIERTTAQAQDVRLNFASLEARSAGATGLFEADGNSADLNSSAKISFAAGAAGFMPGYFAKSGTGQAGFAFYDAGGFVREMIYNASDPNAVISVGGAQQFQLNQHVELRNNPLTTQPAVTIQSLSINSNSSPITLTGLLTISAGIGGGGPGSLLKVGGGNSTISGTGLTAGANRELILRPDSIDDTLTISAPITSTTTAVTKSGEGTLILSGANAFTGTTYVNGGRLTVRGSGAIGAGSDVVLAGGTYELLGFYANSDSQAQTFLTNKNVVVTGSGTLTAGRLTPSTEAATNKTIAFANLSIGNQVLTTDPAVYAAGANPPFAGVFELSFTGTTTFRDVLPPTFNVTGTQAIGTTPGLTLVGEVSGPSGFIKRGTGTLALSGVNTFGGSGAVVELQEGVLSIAADSALGNPATSLLLNAGEATDKLLTTANITSARSVALGQITNTIEVTAGTTLELDGLVTSNIAANLVKRGTGTLVLTNTSNTFGGTGAVIDLQAGTLLSSTAGALGSTGNTLQLNGGIFGVPATAPASFSAPQNLNLALTAGTIDIAAPITLTLAGRITSTGTVANLTKTGPGSLTLTNAGNSFGGVNSTLDILGGGTLTVTSGGALGDPANTVRLTGGFVGNGTSTASQNFILAQSTVAGTNAVFNVPGANTFTLAGVLSHSTTAVDFTKTGTGTLELTNANTLLGGGKIFDVQEGFLGVSSDSSLGVNTNTVRLGVSGGTVGGLRALGTFTTARAITLNNTSNKIDVTQGNALTLSTPFTLPGGGASNALVKGDLGTLVLNTNQSAWTGAITINAGAIRVSSPGTTTILGSIATGTTITNIGGLELAGGVTISEPLTINTLITPGASTTMAGSSFGGVLRSLGVTNTYSGPISVTGAPDADNTFRSVVFGADLTGSLALTGTITVDVSSGPGRVSNIIFAGDANGGNAGTLSGTVVKNGTGILKLIKSGTSTWTVSGAPTTTPPSFDALEIRSGTLKEVTTLTSGGNAFASTTALSFTGGGTFLYDNQNATGNKAQSLGALTFNAGDGVVLLNRFTGSNNLTVTFSALSPRAAGATGLFQATGTGATYSTAPTTKVAFTAAPPNGFIDPGLFAQNSNGVTGFAFYDTTLGTARPLNYTSDAGLTVGTVAGGVSTLTAQPNKHVQLSASGVVTGQNAVPLLSLNMLGGSSIALTAGNALTISNSGGGAGAILKSNGGTVATISGGAGASLTTGNKELILRADTSSDLLTISVPITATSDLTKSGAGTVTLTGANAWSGSTFVNGGNLVIQGPSALPTGGGTGLGLGGGTFTYQADGDSTGRLENLGTQKDVTVTGSSTIAVSKLAAVQSLNKTITFGTLAIGNVGLTVTPSNGYGVRFTGATSLNEALPTAFNVSGGANSNVVQGLSLAGVVSSTSGVGLVKLGTGALLLENAANSFGGVGALIDIQNGVVAAASNGALGNLANNVVLGSQTSTFRANGTFTTDRTFYLNATLNQMEVTQGNVLTLNTGLNLGGTATPATNALTKNNNGVLELGANSPATWTGAIAINAGAIRLKTESGLGSTGRAGAVVSITNPGIALQLSGSNTVYNAYPIVIANTGINSGGALENVSGNNLWTGAVTTGGVVVTDQTVIGSSGGTLTLSGVVTSAIFNETQSLTVPTTETAFTLTFNGQTTAPITTATATGATVQSALQALPGIGAGNVSVIGAAGGPYAVTFAGTLGNTDVAQLTTALVSGTGSAAIATTLVGGPRPLTLAGAGDVTIATTGLGSFLSLTKIGSGTATVGVASPLFVGNLTVNAGTFAIKGNGAKIGGTGAIVINDGGAVTVDDTGTPVANRLSSRTVTFNGGSLNLIGSGTGNTTETITSGAAIFSRGLSTITVTAGTGRQASLVINGAINNVASLQNTAANTGVTPNVGPPTAASVLFRGTNIGQPLVGTTGSGAGTTHPVLTNVAGITISNGTNALFTFPGQTGARDTVTKGILPWALVDTDTVNGVGTSFATFDTATNPVDGAGNTIPGLNPIRPLRLAEQTTIITANANLTLSAAQSIAATTTFNSLTLRDGGGLTAGPLNQIILSSGGILAQAGNTGINNGILNAAAGAAPLNIWTPGIATSLTITSVLTGGQAPANAGLIKAGAGTLVLAGPQSNAISGLSANSFNALTAINQGTLKLASGNNTLFPNNFVEVGPDGILDLGGHSQYVQALFSDGAVAGGGGVVTSTGGTGTLVANYDNALRNWAGSINGDVAFSRSGQNTVSFYSNQNYTGITQINGGTTVLRDAAALSGTSAISINFATLNLDNAGGTANSQNRINDSATVTLRGAALTLLGRPQTETTETMGALSIAPGLSTITVNASSGLAPTGVYASDLTFFSLARQAGSAVNFVGLANAGAVALGSIGSNPRVLFTMAPSLNSNLIGGWAVVTNPAAVPEFASYVPTVGVGALGATGFAAYDAPATFATATPTQNIRLIVAGTVPSGGLTINSLNLVGFGIGAFSLDTSTLTLASGGLIHSGANVSIGATPSGQRGQLTAGTTAAASELLIYNGANILTINSKVVNNTAGGVVTLVLSGTGTVTLASQATNAHTGGTVVNNGLTVNTTGAAAGIAVFPAGGLTINGGIVTTTAAGQILPTNNLVTLNGSATLNMVGDNALSGIAFNNTGGTANPIVNSGGTLTLTASPNNTGISATSSNVTTSSIATLAGRFSLPSGSTAFAIDPIIFNGVQVAPTQATLVTQGLVGSGGITKTGAGVLQFNAQSLFTGQVNVMGGGIQFGVANGGSRFANVNLGAAGTRINMNGVNTNIGSLSGVTGSVVTNSSPTAVTLTLGFGDVLSDARTFAGRFARFGDGIPASLNITKIGAGTLNLTGAGSDSTGILSLQGGTVKLTGVGSTSFTTNNILTGGTLTLDNATTNVNSRLGGTNANAVTLSIQGGTVNYIGNPGADTTEVIDIFTVGNGAGVLDLQPNAARKLNLVVSTTFTALQAGGTLFIKNLATLPFEDGLPLNGEASINLGAIAFNAPAGSGSGFPIIERAIRPDIVAAMGSGPATSFVTKDLDPDANWLRTLNPVDTLSIVGDEVVGEIFSGAVTPTNYDLSSVSNISENTSANSVVLRDGAGIHNTAPANLGLYGPNATLLTQTVFSGGILAVEGGTSSINTPLLSTANNLALIFHAYGDLNVGGSVAAGTGGLTKSGTGTLTIAGRGYYTGATVVNAGTLMWDGPQDNNVAVVPASTTSLTSALTVNGGVIDINGHSQAFGTILSTNPNAGMGGEITNSGLTTVTLTSSTATSSVFGGKITGLLDFVKTGAGTLSLTSPSNYTGSTTIRGGGITLRDRGALTDGVNGTSDINIIYGTLSIDNTQLNAQGVLSPVRVPNVPISLFGGTLQHLAGGSGDYAATINDTVTLAGGANTITSQITGTAGTSGVFTLGDISHAAPTATVNFPNAGGAGFSQRTFVIAWNGSSPVTNGIIGPWATVGGSDFAAYNTTNGVVGLGTYTLSALATGGLPTQSVTIAASPAAIGDTVLNVLRTTATATVSFTSAASTLTFGDSSLGVSGGLLINGATTVIGGGAAATNGAITSGGSELFVYTNNTGTINSVIKDGGNGAVSLVKSGGSTLTLTGNNTYTGTTIVNQGTLILNNPTATGAAGASTVPGALLINNAATTTLSVANQLRTTAAVTIDGAGVLNTVATNTIGRVLFNNRGGNAAPTVAVASNLTLAGGGVAAPGLVAGASITSNNDVLSTTPTISGTSLTLSNAQPIISTSGAAPTSLLITAPMHPFSLRSDTLNGNVGVPFGGNVVKTGTGSLALNPTVGLTATTSPSSATLTDLASVAGLAVGMSVSGTNITAGSVIKQIRDNGDVLLSLPTGTAATATNTITFAGSTFTNGLTVSQGSLILASSSVLNPEVPINPPIINGPVGVGTLTLADGASIMSDNTLRTLHNAVSVLGNFLFGPPAGSGATVLAGGGVNLLGPVALSAGDHTISVNGPLNISTIGGRLTGPGGTLTKAGDGTLVLSNGVVGQLNNWGGPLAVTGGVLRSTAVGAVPAGIDLSVSSGAVFDTPGVNQTIKTLAGDGAITNSSTTLAATLFIGGTSPTDTTTVANSTFGGSISGIFGDNSAVPPAAFNLTKVGAGTVTLTGKNTYRGATDVNSGTLRVALTGSLRIASNFSVTNGAIADIDGTITADSGGVQVSGINSRLRGSGTIGANVIILSDGPNLGGIIEPVRNGTKVLTINDGGSLELKADATMLYRADSLGENGNRIRITDDSELFLPSSGTWTLKIDSGTVAIPHGLKFVLFDGDDGVTDLLNGNTGTNDAVGNYVIDWGTSGWSLSTTLPDDEKGIHFDLASNSIVLIGVVPEPGTGSLVFGSLAVALGLQRFRRRRSSAAA